MNKIAFIESIKSPGNKLKLIIYDTPFSTKELMFDIGDVESVEVLINTDKSIVELIEQSDNLEEAIQYASNPVLPEEEKALNNLQSKLKPRALENQIKRIKDSISFMIASKGSKLSVDDVLLFLCENTLGIAKITVQLEIKDEIKIINEIGNAIKKLEEIDF
ncbi:MAG: hypothetical protein M0R51_13355 [Clostridia bacterium]|jgi:hypothetical protein|nr:hypothetical protein [Clostridia bacterium]MDD3086224.1 hypothetical protein [Candidatus ainarchaeum sp.]